MRLSVVLATYNEEKNLALCLRSVKGWCDEIIIVDGSSTDSTVSIAKQYGARVIITDNPPIFHINKQKAIDTASGKWILQLDADERLTEELRREIDRATARKDVNGFWLPRKNFFLGRFLMKGGVYPDFTLRLYRRGKGRLPQQDVHEQAEVIGKTAYLTNPLIHMADISLSRYFDRFNRYTDLISESLRRNENNYSLTAVIMYCLIKPINWFILTYIRHKGFLDSWQGFLFSLFSACRFPVAYIKFRKKTYASCAG